MRKVLVAALAVLGLAGCSDPINGGGSGRTRVVLTDAPFLGGNIARVDVYVSKIEANTSTDTIGSDSGAGSGWVTIATPARTYNLLELQQGTTALAGEVDLPAGQYRAIRVTINTSQSSVTRTDGSPVAVKWPVAGELALNALVENPLEVPAGGAQIVIDFDVARTFLDDGTGGLWFIPWIRAVNDAETGSIGGTVTAPDIEGHPAPLAGATVIVAHVAGPGALGAIAATTNTDAQGHFVVGWLHEGFYSMSIQPPLGSGLASWHADFQLQVTTGHRTVQDAGLERGTGTDTSGTGGGATGPVASVMVRVWETFAPTDSLGAYAELRNADGALLNGRTVTWTIGDPTVATIAWQGGQSVLLRGLKNGSTTLTATSEGKSNTVTVSLVAGSGGGGNNGGGSVASVSLPATISAVAGDSVGVFATLRDSVGNTISNRTVTFSVADTTVIHIMGAFGQSVVLRATKAGSTTLTASIEGKTANAPITVH